MDNFYFFGSFRNLLPLEKPHKRKNYSMGEIFDGKLSEGGRRYGQRHNQQA